MKISSFIIGGDPVPYLRMTQGEVKLMRIPDHKLRPGGLRIKTAIRRYFAYKDRVHIAAWAKRVDPEPKGKTYLNVMIYFRNRRHADPENVRKGIQDAIFSKDKMVAGGVDFDYDHENPRVEISVYEYESERPLGQN